MATEQVFLSNSHADREACTVLEKAGIGVFRDQESLRIGDRWMERLQDALEHCAAFVVLVGRDGVQRWVGAEVQVALSRHLSEHEDAQRPPIFPILLEGATPVALPPFLALHQSARVGRRPSPSRTP
jgi:hypothetical protein